MFLLRTLDIAIDCTWPLRGREETVSWKGEIQTGARDGAWIGC